MAKRGTLIGELQTAWAKFWARSWKLKAPVLILLGFVLLALVVPSEEDEPDALAATAEDTETPADAVSGGLVDRLTPAAVEPTAANTPKPTETPKPTATPKPTVSPEKLFLDSYNDNKGFMTRASAEKINLTFDAATGAVTIDIYPSTIFSDGDVLTIGGASAIVANRALWTTYPAVEKITVNTWVTYYSPTGQASVEVGASVTTLRATARGFAYDGLKARSDDNKNFFCISDAYRIHPATWKGIFFEGCMEPWGSSKP